MAAATASSPNSLATASGLLLGGTIASMGICTLLGWLAGSWGIGLLVGLLAGIPLGVALVYLVYAKR
jgi:hypothetical protein